MEEIQFKCRPVFRCITFNLCVCCYCSSVLYIEQKTAALHNIEQVAGFFLAGMPAVFFTGMYETQ